MKRRKDIWDSIMTYDEIDPYLNKIKIFTPTKRKYYIETLYSHYNHTHYSSHLEMTRKIISEKYPEYVNCYDIVLKHRYGYMFNMMIMERKLLEEYCEWLFDILFELGKVIDMPELSAYQERFYGRVSEIIFNVWLNKKIDSGEISSNQLMEISHIHMEKINWLKKGGAFLKAKLFHQKYEASF